MIAIDEETNPDELRADEKRERLIVERMLPTTAPVVVTLHEYECDVKNAYAVYVHGTKRWNEEDDVAADVPLFMCSLVDVLDLATAERDVHMWLRQRGVVPLALTFDIEHAPALRRT